MPIHRRRLDWSDHGFNPERPPIDDKAQVLEKLFAAMPEAVVIQDAHQPPLTRDVNAAAEKMFSYDRDELIGRGADLLHADPKALEEMRRLVLEAASRQGFYSRSDYLMKRKDGRTFPTEFAIYELKAETGERWGWVSIIRDESERRLAEEELHRSEKWFRGVFDSQAAGVIILDAKTKKVVRVNRSYARLLGYSAEEMIGLEITEIVSPSEAERAQADQNKLINGQIDGYVIERLARKKDGSEILVEARAAVIKDDQGRPIYTLSVINDLADRARAREEGEKRLKLQGVLEMAGAACHELNQPLQALLGQLELTAMTGPNALPAGKRMDEIMAQLDRLMEITAKIQKIARYETREYIGEGMIIDLDKSSIDKSSIDKSSTD